MTVPSITLPCKFSRVVDGDTLDAVISISARVRLLDCWAPEADTPEGVASTEHLRRVAEGQDGYLHIPIKEGNGLQALFSFGRILGNAEVDSVDLGELQIATGHATRSKP